MFGAERCGLQAIDDVPSSQIQHWQFICHQGKFGAERCGLQA
jgi:hypothetical protein